jgi:hypothetical protein
MSTWMILRDAGASSSSVMANPKLAGILTQEQKGNNIFSRLGYR